GAIDDHDRLAPARRGDDRGGDALRRHCLLERRAAGRAPRDLATQLVSANIAGADRAGVDTAAGEFVVEHLGESDHPPLARAVGGVGRSSDQPELGGDQHDRAAAALAHPAEHPLAEPDRGANMQPPALLEVGWLDVLDEVAMQHTGAADEHVDWSERADHLSDRALTLA